MLTVVGPASLVTSAFNFKHSIMLLEMLSNIIQQTCGGRPLKDYTKTDQFRQLTKTLRLTNRQVGSQLRVLL